MESDVVRYLYTKIDEGAFKFNKIEPLVIPRSDYVIQGDEYYAEIMMAASDTTQPPVVTVEGQVLQTVQGKGLLKIPTNRLGQQSWSGTIQIKNPDGTDRIENVSGEYMVSAPSVVISPTKMNVFYEGVDNPVSISVPGIPSEDIRPTISSGQLLRRGNDYRSEERRVGKECRSRWSP